MFGPAAKSFVDSFILIYVSHPFDVGDKISLDGSTSFVVDKISLYTTSAHTGDGRAVIFPNPSLLAIQLYNFTRSLSYSLTIQLQVDILTTVEQLQALEAATKEFIVEKTEGVWKEDSFAMSMDKIEFSKMCTVALEATLNGVTWAEGSKYKEHKSKLLFFLHAMCKELGISYHPPTQNIRVSKEKRE